MQKEQKERKDRAKLVRSKMEETLGVKFIEMFPARDKVLIMEYLMEQPMATLRSLILNDDSMPVFVHSCADMLVSHDLKGFMEIYRYFKEEAEEGKKSVEVKVGVAKR